MPSNEVPTPRSSSAVDRLSFSSASVRGTVPNVFGSAAHSCACFDAEPLTVTSLRTYCFEAEASSAYNGWHSCFETE